jgi:uroporphyrinogen-III synthase
MPTNRIDILSTRELTADILAIAAAEAIDIDIIPFIITRPAVSDEGKKRIAELSLEKASIVFTSIKAIDAVLPYLKNVHPSWSIYCMEGESKNAVSQSFGENTVTGTGRNSADLAALIRMKGISQKLIYFSGNLRREELPAKIKMQGIDI